MGSSRSRARTRVPCIGRRILNHCTTRDVPTSCIFKMGNLVLWKVAFLKLHVKEVVEPGFERGLSDYRAGASSQFLPLPSIWFTNEDLFFLRQGPDDLDLVPQHCWFHGRIITRGRWRRVSLYHLFFSICTHTYIHTYLHRIYIFCVCAYIYIYIYIRTHTHIIFVWWLKPQSCSYKIEKTNFKNIITYVSMRIFQQTLYI